MKNLDYGKYNSKRQSMVSISTSIRFIEEKKIYWIGFPKRLAKKMKIQKLKKQYDYAPLISHGA
jgi:hypothetical protein